MQHRKQDMLQELLMCQFQGSDDVTRKCVPLSVDEWHNVATHNHAHIHAKENSTCMFVLGQHKMRVYDVTWPNKTNYLRPVLTGDGQQVEANWERSQTFSHQRWLRQSSNDLRLPPSKQTVFNEKCQAQSLIPPTCTNCQ